MRRFAIGAALMLALAITSVAAARGPANEFAAGSAKTEMDIFVGNEHASFSAHNVPGSSCEATGQIVYESDFLSFTAKIDELTIIGNGAFFAGTVTKAVFGPANVGDTATFDATDSGLPGGTGDTFILDAAGAAPPEQIFCYPPITGHPITSGNVVIKTTGP